MKISKHLIMLSVILVAAFSLNGCDPRGSQNKNKPHGKKLQSTSEAVDMLIVALEESQTDVQWIAVENLVVIGTPAVEPLIKSLSNEHPNVRRRSADALGRIQDKRALEPLIIALDDEVAQVRVSAAFALGVLIDNRAVDPLIAKLKDKIKPVRNMSYGSLMQITGQNFGPDYDSWFNWWEEEKKKTEHN